ncbi:MAG: hypothetical protein OXN81_10315 [Alphaproteobacteria bacterium]|nr:hypothetical protein [Alphaproteobacteria bacterium]
MRLLSACCLGMVAVLYLSACGGGGGSNSQAAVTPAEIGSLTGLSEPIETGAVQQARQQDIVSRADSLIYSTMHSELVFPDRTLTIRQLSECSGTACELLDPTTGVTETATLDDAVAEPGDLEPVGSAHGTTLMSLSGHEMGLDFTLFGAWMEHASFSLNKLRAVSEEFEGDTLHTAALGELTDRPLTGSASWLGIMVGTPIAGNDRGNRLVGTAALNYDMSAGGLDVAFSAISNIDRGTAHSVETVIFSDLEVGPDGTFARGQSGARIQGGLYGPGHAEAAGIFEQSNIVGAFGARRQ